MKFFNPFKQYNGIYIPEGIYALDTLSSTAKLLYGRLLRYAGENGKAYPKQETLSGQLGITKSGLRKALGQLKSEKLIYVQPGNPLTHQPNTYFFIKHKCFDHPGPDEKQAQPPESDFRGTPENNSSVTPESNSKGTLQEESHKQESHNTNNKERVEELQLFEPDQPAPKPKTQKEKHDAAVFASPLPDNFNTTLFAEAWQDFCDHRSELKNGLLTERAIKALFKKLEPFDVSHAVSCLNDSVANGWKGIFPERAPSKNSPPANPKHFEKSDYTEGVPDQGYDNV